MKIIVPALASFALAVAPVASAQVSCSQVIELTVYALDDFDAIVGDKIDGDLYGAEYWLADAEECSIDSSLDSVYTCIWVYSSLTEATSALNKQMTTISPCLADWKPDPIKPPADASGTFRTLQGTFYEGAGDNADLEWGVYLEEHTLDDGRDWHVVIGIAYLW